MMTQSLIAQLAPTVESAVQELFDTARKHQAHSGDLILFCENGHYWGELQAQHSPYIIGPGIEGLADFDRSEFFRMYRSIPFEHEYETATTQRDRLEVRKRSIHFELMIYSHFWEATPNLKALKQLANLVDSKEYEWEIRIPETERYTFIKNQIRDVFESHSLAVAQVIKDAYASQIRNAFAHCQYSFRSANIYFANYSPAAPWKVHSISFDDWERKFCLSALLYDFILKARQGYKRAIAARTREVAVRIPVHDGGFRESLLEWFEPRKSFVFKI